MSTPGSVYRTREDADPERERAALGEIYAFILERHQSKGTAAAGDPETINGTVFEGDSADARSIPEER